MLRALACAVLFLTRIPLPRMTLTERDMARSAAWFAWVGGLIAGCLWLCALLTPALGTRLSALLVVAAWLALRVGSGSGLVTCAYARRSTYGV